MFLAVAVAILVPPSLLLYLCFSLSLSLPLSSPVSLPLSLVLSSLSLTSSLPFFLTPSLLRPPPPPPPPLSPRVPDGAQGGPAGALRLRIAAVVRGAGAAAARPRDGDGGQGAAPRRSAPPQSASWVGRRTATRRVGEEPTTGEGERNRERERD